MTYMEVLAGCSVNILLAQPVRPRILHRFELIIIYHTTLGNLVFKMQFAFDHIHSFILHSSKLLLLAKYFFFHSFVLFVMITHLCSLKDHELLAAITLTRPAEDLSLTCLSYIVLIFANLQF